MHAHNRHPGSPPSSPTLSPLSRHHNRPFRSCRLPPSREFFRGPLSLLFVRRGICLVVPMIYVAGVLFYVGILSSDALPVTSLRNPVGSVYLSPQLYAKLRPEMDADNSSADTILTVWTHSYEGGEWRSCIKSNSQALPESNGYIWVEANGGLNQQRTSICNAVAVAGYLNATLLVPHLSFHSIWKDPSQFDEIYDLEFFIKSLENDVRVVSTVPEYIMERFAHNITNVYNFKIKAWASIDYYSDMVLPKLLEEKIIKFAPFANRLSNHAPPAEQRLRCLTNYEALRFSPPIQTLGETLVARMREYSVHNNGKYISVHLRFEEDMVAFSCCEYDGGKQEKHDMDVAREVGWRGKFTRPGRVIHPSARRLDGRCPLTPLEVGLMLRGMGFDSNTSIYLASGKIYDSERHMAPLFEMFPLLKTKEMLASADELAPFQHYSSRMAAIDYSVCLHSEVFVITQGGNFPQFLVGHRRYLYGGHAKSIRPNKRKLAAIFGNLNIGWKGFKRQMHSMLAHSDSRGIEIKRPRDSIYSFPCPDCMCKVNNLGNLRTSAAAVA